MNKIIKLCFTATAGVSHLNLKKKYRFCIIKIVSLTYIIFCDRQIERRAKCLSQAWRNPFSSQCNILYRTFSAHTLTGWAISFVYRTIPVENQFGLYCLLFSFTGHGFFHHTVEFNSSIKRKIYSQILLYATRELHLLRVQPRNFFRLRIYSEFQRQSSR